MMWRANSRSKDGYSALIKRDDNVGYYVYIFKDGICLQDYLEDNLDIAMQVAAEVCGVDVDDWVYED